MTLSKSLFYTILLIFIFFNDNIHSSLDQNRISNTQIIPEHIEVGPFFNGQKIKVTAEIPKCTGVMVKLIGNDIEFNLNWKGKKAFIWLNVAQVSVKNAPSIYILACSDKMNKLCPIAVQEKEMLGYNALKGKVTFESTAQLSGLEFDEFIKLKESSGYYNFNINTDIIRKRDGKQFLDATLDIPSFISSGEYTVEIYCFTDGNLVDKSNARLTVKKVGLTLIVANLATESPAAYGILAIVVAIIAGSIIGMIFIKKRNSGS